MAATPTAGTHRSGWGARSGCFRIAPRKLWLLPRLFLPLLAQQQRGLQQRQDGQILGATCPSLRLDQALEIEHGNFQPVYVQDYRLPPHLRIAAQTRDPAQQIERACIRLQG